MTVEALPANEVTWQHRWQDAPERRIHGTEFDDGNARTERTCSHCQLVKITVHAADGSRAWREWRHPASLTRFQCEHTPPCPGPTAVISP